MPLLSDFEQQCIDAPNAIAFIEADRICRYQQVGELAEALSYLIHAKNHKTQRVIIALNRGIDAAIAILATLNIGACYIPLDLKNPPSRLNFIIDDADCQCIVGKGGCPKWVEQPDLWLDINKTNLNHRYKAKDIPPSSLAAILYTSGSTGLPKGVALSHRAIKNFADWAADTFDITGNDKIASLTPFYFDLSVFDLFSGLSRGAMIHFIPDRLTFSPSRLTAWLSAHDMTVWYTVPSILSFIALKGALSITPLPRLKSILFAGEVFHTPQLLSLCEQLPAVNFYNLYGPTETNVCCYWPVDREQLKTGNPIPIGQAACGSALMIHPDTNELLVKSENNLSGYWQQGQLMPTLSADGYYSTGDGVRLNEKGEYCYQGRLDRMLKCSGYRVEPAEIERIILKNKQVKQCVVLGIKDKTSGQRPVAIVVLDNDATIAEIVKPTRQALPAYMQPCHYIALDVLPYLSHGKINYHSLQQQVDNL